MLWSFLLFYNCSFTKLHGTLFFGVGFQKLFLTSFLGDFLSFVRLKLEKIYNLFQYYVNIMHFEINVTMGMLLWNVCYVLGYCRRRRHAHGQRRRERGAESAGRRRDRQAHAQAHPLGSIGFSSFGFPGMSFGFHSSIFDDPFLHHRSSGLHTG